MTSYSSTFGHHLNRRDQNAAGRKRNIEDGLQGEKALADMLIERGIGFEFPGKHGTTPDSVDFNVSGESWSVKASRMWLPVVCAAQAQQEADQYVFFALRGNSCEALGIIRSIDYFERARVIRRGQPITDRFTAHYDLYVVEVAELHSLAHALDAMAPEGVDI